MIIHIDVETYSSVDIRAGVRKYTSSPDFKIMLIAPLKDSDFEIPQIDFELNENLDHWSWLKKAIMSPDIIKVAHNANFEIECFRAVGIRTHESSWRCTMAMARTLSLPGSLGKVLKAIDAPEETQKLAGTQLINFFSKPDNKGQKRNPKDHPEKWEEYKTYNKQDVISESYLYEYCMENECKVSWDLWQLDHKINNNGIRVDKNFCEAVIKLNQNNVDSQIRIMKTITKLENPNSIQQLTGWLEAQGVETKSIDKQSVSDILASNIPDDVRNVLLARKASASTSVAKFKKMLSLEVDECIYHCFMYYGASKTGRWTSKDVQFQNLPKTKIANEDIIRIKDLVNQGINPCLIYPDDILKQMIRPAIISSPGKALVAADFSAIEARVLAWIAGEDWVNEVFATHGKIYEAQASKMYGVPVDDISKEKNPELRTNGKVATLALGYGGGEGALKSMGYKGTSLECNELKSLWRKANKKIVAFWYYLEDAVRKCINEGGEYNYYNLSISRNDNFLKIKLPSRRHLSYYKPHLRMGKFREGPAYWFINSETKQWEPITTWGGKLCENVIQAIARDCLATAMWRLDKLGATIRFHVHDEIIAEDISLEKMIKVLEYPIPWATGLVLRADGYESKFYRKD